MSDPVKLDLQQRTDEWKAWRRGGIGSSDASAAVGLSRWKDIHQLWAEKTGAIEEQDVVGEFIELGNDLEDGIRRAAVRHLGVEIEPGGCYQHGRFDWLRASIDGLTANADKAIVECKLVTINTFWRWGSEASGEVPAEYRCQILEQLMVTGAPYAWLVALIAGSEIRIYKIKRDREAFDQLFAGLKRFWENVQSNTPPPIDETQGARDYMARRWPSPENTIREATPEEIVKMDDLRLARMARKDAETVEGLAANTMIEAIGDLSGIRNGSEKVTFKPDKNGRKSLRCPRQWGKK